MPLSVVGAPAATRVPDSGETRKDRTVMRWIGTVVFGVVPGSTHPHALSGIRYAGFIQNCSNGLSTTVISERFFTQYVAYQPGTTSRAGNPLSIGSGAPFIWYATMTFGSSSTRLIASDLTKSGTLGNAGLSSPSNVTSTAPCRTPAAVSTSLRRQPTHSALPIAPSPHCPPSTRGAKRPRLFPEHWLTAVTAARGNLVLRSSSESSSG